MEFGEKLQYCGVRTERIYWLDWNASFACWTQFIYLTTSNQIVGLVFSDYSTGRVAI